MRKDIFKNAPFKTVEEYTEWWLDKRGQYDLLEMAEEEREASYQFLLGIQPLDSIVNTPHDMMEVVEDEISANTYFDCSVDVDQFLVSGKVRKIGGESIYMQGNEYPRWMEGKYQQRQDKWEESIS